jgi:hypothetical protein
LGIFNLKNSTTLIFESAFITGLAKRPLKNKLADGSPRVNPERHGTEIRHLQHLLIVDAGLHEAC